MCNQLSWRQSVAPAHDRQIYHLELPPYINLVKASLGNVAVEPLEHERHIIL